MSCLLQSFDRPGISSPVRGEKASADALGPGGHSCCQTLRGMSASGWNLLANCQYSCLFHSRRRSSPFANSTSRAICASWTSGGLPPRTPIPFMRLCRPRANGRKPHAASRAVLTARQSSHASQAQRDRPPAVARKQMMHRSYSRETSHPSHFSGGPRPCTTAISPASAGTPSFFAATDPATPRKEYARKTR